MTNEEFAPIDSYELRALRALAQSAMDTANHAKSSIDKHEEVCAVRYEAINTTLHEIRSILKGAAVLLLTVLGTVAWALLQKKLGM